jgi:CDP-diacylglycerol--glycerol-3-phosphate 3-phosphatidyltransferase
VVKGAEPEPREVSLDAGYGTETRLLGRAAAATALSLAATLTAWTLLLGAVSAPAAAGWLTVAGLLHVVETRALYRNLDENRRRGERRVLPGLGSANAVTLARGTLFAWTGGFLAVALVEGAGAFAGGALAFAPALAYGLGALLDGADGALARATGRVTVLGTHLDAEFDGLGILVASLVGVAVGAMPAAYLLAGASRYLWLLARGVRRLRGRSLATLPERPSRRTLAGLQMCYAFLALLPVTGSDVGTVGAVVVGAPFLLGWLRDWLYATGRLTE